MKNFSITKTIFFATLFASCGFVKTSSSKCDRTPEGSSAKKTPPDGNFKLKIATDPVRYLPGEIYNISLESVSRFGIPSSNKFAGFYVTIEKDPIDGKPVTYLGSFDIGPESIYLAKISRKCDHLVTHSSSFPKNEVFIQWTAPPVGSGCVVFKSTVIVHRDVWYSDDGDLSKTLCEDEADSGDVKPIVLDVCTACDEAKYELTFEGLWSRHTHPRHFPDNGWLTKFSDIIGASHSVNYTFWKYGEPSSDGMKDLAEQGSTLTLDNELKDGGEHIRTIIKARGISYPNVTGKTFAVFRVDSEHHLVSLVSMIYPSPDWFVGVSGLELCLSNGSWADQKVLNLYPYDAGTDTGPTYTSADQPTIPREAIRRIKPNQPNDPRSPFHDPDNKEMKPLGKLLLTRQKLYEKNCEEKKDENEEGNDEENREENVQHDCATTKWSKWSDCDATCGKGQKVRYRKYNDQDAEQFCSKDLEESSECQGEVENCNDGEPRTDDTANSEDFEDPYCPLTEWSEWSACSKKCKKGQRTRSRTYEKNYKPCFKKYSKVPLEEKEPCEDKCFDDNNNNKDPMLDVCETTEWSRFTGCSAKCGLGEKIRARLPKVKRGRPVPQEITQLYNKLTNKNKMYSDDDFDDSDFDVLDIMDENHLCFQTGLIDRQICEVRNTPCDDDEDDDESITVPDFCMKLPRKGNCKAQPDNRWFYNAETQSCGLFTYTGCEGFLNNFLTLDACISVCMNNTISDTRVQQNDEQESHNLYGVVVKTDCKLSQWKTEACNAKCGEGIRKKYRSITQHPRNGGRSCNQKLVRFERCYRNCETHHIVTPRINFEAPQHHHHNCRYSEWNPWSPCSKTCGDTAVQIRTRTVINLNTHLCNERVQERRCEVMPCLVGSGYNYNFNNNYNFRP